VALAAAFDTALHITDLLAAVRTRFTNFRARFAVQCMVIAIAAHEVDTGGTGRDTIKHQFDVNLFNMISSGYQAMAGQGVGTDRLTFATILDAVFFRYSGGIHGIRILLLSGSYKWERTVSLPVYVCNQWNATCIPVNGLQID
jgi:hypothetical protein